MSARRALWLWLAGALAALLAASCGGSSAGSEADGPGAAAPSPEQATITVGTMPVIDTAPLELAIKNGYFAEEGLEVETRTIQGGADGVPKLESGGLDISFANYVSAFLAHSNGTKMRIAAEAYNAGEGVLQVTAMPGSGIREPSDLAGATVAVNTLENVGTLTVKSILKTHDVDTDAVNFVEKPFPEMASALESGSVDAAWMVEPFISQAKTSLGAYEVLDSASGATEGFPIAGYVTTQEFQNENPKTVAAFKRAIQRGQRLASDRAKVERVVPTYTKIEPKIAAIATIGEYPTTIEATRLQRVPDLMREFGVLDSKLDAAQLVGGSGGAQK